MGFILDGLDAETYDRCYSDHHLLSRILGYFRPRLSGMLLVAVMIVLNSLMNLALPVLIARSLDSLAESITFETTGLLVGAILAAGAMAWVFNFFRQEYTARVVGDVVLNLRQDAFAAVMGHEVSFYDEHPSGKIVSRVTSDTQDFATVITLTLELLSQLLLVILLTAVLFYIDVYLALLALAIGLLLIVATLRLRRIARLTTRRARRALARVNANVLEVINGISVAKSFRQEQAIYDEFSRVNEQSYQVNVRQGLLFSGTIPALLTVAGMGTTAVVYFGGLNVLAGTLSAGNWFLFVESINIFWLPLTSIASFWSQFQLGLSASERVFALIDAEPGVVQIDQQPAPHLAGRIEFKNLDFRYSDRESVLQGFNLTIEAGETVALVGHTGAGKSSLGKLIARHYEFQGGRLLIDGRDIRTFDLHAYRSQLGVVPQTPFLFSGTVADNIRYTDPQATDDDVAAVAYQIGGGDWLEALPEGLHTPVGEGGKNLSMGQRQLVALARVLLQAPSILIMDEAIASVDPLTEAQIQESLDVVLKDRTAIVIAHRLSTVRRVDRIIVLHQGRIIEQGNHPALMLQGGHYAELYNTYFRHQSADYRTDEGFVPVHLSALI